MARNDDDVTGDVIKMALKQEEAERRARKAAKASKGTRSEDFRPHIVTHPDTDTPLSLATSLQ